jgi:hypothetical protein
MFKVAISGKANSGKNTFATFLTEFLTDSYRIYAFADPIKEIILKMFPQANRASLYGPSSRRKEIISGASDKEGKPLTYRKALTEIGGLGRQFNSTCWIDSMTVDLNNCKESSYLVSDLRFPDEYTALREMNFFIIRIKRDSDYKIDDVSETSQDLIPDSVFDFVIDNNKSVEDLRATAMKIANILKGNS